MKKIRLGIRITIGLCAALGWWGLLYPELVLTPDTVRVVQERGPGQDHAPQQTAHGHQFILGGFT